MDTVGRSKRQIQDYIKRQLDEDQMSRKDFIDPFTGGKNIKDIRTPLKGPIWVRNAVGRPICGPLRGVVSITAFRGSFKHPT